MSKSDTYNEMKWPVSGQSKLISGHFGSVVSSYFTFLRWIVFVNLIISLLVIAFIVFPEASHVFFLIFLSTAKYHKTRGDGDPMAQCMI